MNNCESVSFTAWARSAAEGHGFNNDLSLADCVDFVGKRLDCIDPIFHRFNRSFTISIEVTIGDVGETDFFQEDVDQLCNSGLAFSDFTIDNDFH